MFTRDCPEGVTGAECDAGRVYAFKNGEFIRVGNGSSTILRAYILAPYGSNPQKMAASRATTASIDNLNNSLTPDRLLVEILHTDEDKYLRAIPLEEFYKDQKTTKFQKPLIFREYKNSSGPWYDMKGRVMNRKPTSKGVYLKNGVSTIIK